ncbi:MAG TPA: tetratricopeptide repeat protein [Vicinamibacterales bacterium]|nr:tetratricopeptide repeat protein [Vicinamibacterales bacterium]
MCVLLHATVVSVSSAATQPVVTDAILAGYTRLYAGDPDAAYRHFESLRGRETRHLPAWFGLLFALEARLAAEETLQPTFEALIDPFIAHATERLARSAADDEALFYLAQAYLLRSTYRLENDKGVWGAARDAARAKGYIDDYIKRRPEHGDAYFVLGLYNYYVDIAPSFIKVLRVLLFLPSGSRAEGLKQLERTARSGSLFAPLAESALADIDGSPEGRLAEAVPMAERIVQRYPGNADMRLTLAQMYTHPSVEAYDRAAQQYSAVIDAATTGSPRHLAERYRGILGLSSLRRNQWRLDEAVALLTPVIDQQIGQPAWVLPSFLLRRGNYRMLLNDAHAIDDARRVQGDATMSTFRKPAAQLIAAITSRRASNEGTIYAALVPGNRLVIERRWDDARAVYDKVAASAPGDLQVRYRLAYLDFARGNYDAAATALQPLTTAPRAPGWLKAASLLTLAWTHDIAGRRGEALTLYKRIVENHENEAAAGSAQLGLLAPYRGPAVRNGRQPG